MGILDLFRGSNDERIAKRLIAEFRAQGERRRMEFVPEESTIVVYGAGGEREGLRNLSNLKYELANTPNSQHDDIYHRFAKGLLDSASAGPTTYAEARPQLRIALRDVAYGERTRLVRLQSGTEKQAKPMLSRPFAGDLAAYCVMDRELSLDYVTDEMVASWGVSVDQAMEDAFVNARAMTFSTESAGTLHFVKGPNSYNASCLVCTDAIRKLPMSGSPVAAAATRDSLSITGSDDLAGLELLAKILEAEIKDGIRHTCGRPLVLTDAGWQLFVPPRALQARFLEIARQYDALFWNDYRELLIKDLEAREEDIFVATLGMFEESETKAAFSAVVWSAGVDTILPPADRVFFYDPEDESKRIALWADVTRVLGSSMQELAGVPHRFRVRDFPSDSDFLAMAAKKI